MIVNVGNEEEKKNDHGHLLFIVLVDANLLAYIC